MSENYFTKITLEIVRKIKNEAFLLTIFVILVFVVTGYSFPIFIIYILVICLYFLFKVLNLFLSRNNINKSEFKILSAIDKSLELQKKLRTIEVEVKLKTDMDLEAGEPFVFLSFLHCVGIGTQPSFICGNAFPTGEPSAKEAKAPIRFGWSLSPDKLLSQMSYYEKNSVNTFSSLIRVSENEGLPRIIDLEGTHMHFYISESFSNKIEKLTLKINNLIVINFTPSELETFPASSNLRDPRFAIPNKISTRLSKEVLDLELLRFGKKGQEKRLVEPVWKLDFPQDLLKDVSAREGLSEE